MYKIILGAIALMATTLLTAQSDRWLQKVDYKMDIDFDVSTHQFTGEQALTYINNSPDTLDRVFYHLYFNAFQPGSMMDVKSRGIDDPDPRVGNRISLLKPNEIGYHRIDELLQDGNATEYEVAGTILEVNLAAPILPGDTTLLEMKFNSQVPMQIRRSGRDNAEGIDYSMAQWYPKLSEYDYQGWHANPYIGREFHGVWGDFDVTVDIDSRYTLGASGVLVNARDIGRGYGNIKRDVAGQTGKTKWHFDAEKVHDFVWAADRDYVVESKKAYNGTMMFFIYQPGERTTDSWQQLPRAMNVALEFMNDMFGLYPYPVYSFIQGGDGGMEYPMATLITGNRSFGSLVGVSVHEWMHSWYQMVLGTNESLYPWMDEGFTSFGSSETMNHLAAEGIFGPGRQATENPHQRSYQGYVNWHNTGLEEAMSTHSDHFDWNRAYSIAAYTKGALFLAQLEYIVGSDAFHRGLKRYYNTWKFKHPNPNDCIRIFEKESGMELDWFKEYWVNSTKTVDYGVRDIMQTSENKTANIYIEKVGKMPMPLDVLVQYENGDEQKYNIPLRIMRGAKKEEGTITLEDWPWTNPVYDMKCDTKGRKIKAVIIDPEGRLADVDKKNSIWDSTLSRKVPKP